MLLASEKRQVQNVPGLRPETRWGGGGLTAPPDPQLDLVNQPLCVPHGLGVLHLSCLQRASPLMMISTFLSYATGVQ